MIPSTVRRVAGVAPQSSPLVSSLAQLQLGAIPLARSCNPSCHQRRYSSSKPSSKSSSPADVGSSSKPSAPNNGSSSHASASSVPSSGEKRKRKPKDATPAVPKLPSVPSTKHIKDEAIALSTFFALHRPISIGQLLPKSVSNDAFAEIFSRPSPDSVISTLTQTVHNLENPQPERQNANGDREQQQQRDATAAENNHARTIYQDSNLQYQLDTMTGQFQPFTAPPAPEPMTDASVAAAAAVEKAAADEHSAMPGTRVFKALVTIEETMGADGSLKVVAHSPQIVDEPARFLERMALRQLTHDDACARQKDERSPTMHAISVKRQRKLKMKKKKYKKLMRKTRNIRRKLDRL